MPSADLASFVARWSASGAAERANKDSFLLELCDALEVPRPEPATGDPNRDLYVFERDAILTHEGSRTTIGKIDLYKHECFLLEAKQGSGEGSKKMGAARRGTPAWNIALRDAFGQALGYARTLPAPPPFLVTCDIGYCFDLYASFDRSWNYRPFPDGQSSRLFLPDLDKFADRLRAVFIDPESLDPSRNSARVTREIAGHIAELAKELEDAGQEPERVATFLMRCLFTMFAEDVGLLPGEIFTEALEKYWLPDPASFPGGVQSLWRAMNEGSNFLIGKLKRFNGGLFKEQSAIPLTRPQLERLLEAARCNWSEVEPAIFGTLLERALDPRERHRLGAHYTPRAYVERLVRPTIEEPLREEWDLVRAEVRRLVADERVEEAKKGVRAFHRKLTKTRVLDPACGTGNFLYVSLDLFKRLESEVLGLLTDLGEDQHLLEMQGVTVTPEQFRGIEVKRWAKEIAELVLWIGYLQWQLRARGSAKAVPEPVLLDYGNIECRDAILAWDRVELVRDETGVPVTRWDGITTKINPITGQVVPDEKARSPVCRYINPREAKWPAADFILGNPPFIGNKLMRNALGSEYVDALRKAYKDVPRACDYVMYWWHRAAALTHRPGITSFGFITTKSISQIFNRRVVRSHILPKGPLSVIFAIPNHPWIDSLNGASVRIAMTSCRSGRHTGKLEKVIRELEDESDLPRVEYLTTWGDINSDLSIGTNVSEAQPLRANSGICGQGVKIVGDGFYAEPSLNRTTINPISRAPVVRPIVSTSGIIGNKRPNDVIDFFGLSEAEAKHLHPSAYQQALNRVKPLRDQNKRASIRETWWRFAWERPVLRNAIKNLRYYLVTLSTAKHRLFIPLDTNVLWDGALFAIALDDPFFLGILSSQAHSIWAIAAGGRIGVGNDPTWTNKTCFDPFPFPECADAHRARIRKFAELLDRHRKRQQSLHPDLTLTGMYNVLEKLRSGEPLAKKEKLIHEQGLVSILKQIHDDLDAAVFDAYGWPPDLTDDEILERLVALNAERAEEERNGLIRWLRPEFQNPSEAKKETQATLPGTEDAEEEGVAAPAPAVARWPKRSPEQVAAVRDLLGARAWSVEQVARSFKGARRKEVEEVLDTLAAVGLAVAYSAPEGRRWRGLEGVAAA